MKDMWNGLLLLKWNDAYEKQTTLICYEISWNECVDFTPSRSSFPMKRILKMVIFC